MFLGEIRPTSGEEPRLTNEHISFFIPLKNDVGSRDVLLDERKLELNDT